MSSGNICAVKSIKLTYDRENGLVRNKAFIVKLLSNIRSGITTPDYDGYSTFCISLNIVVLSGFDTGLETIKSLILLDDIVITDVNTGNGKAK